MIHVTVLLAADVSLRRFEVVVRELAARGLTVTAKMQSLNLINGTIDESLVDRLRVIRDVTKVIVR